jgi:protein-S-isoprenylcysteine O-methyltransferase Ste14
MFEPPGEPLVHLALAVFGALAIALSAGRSLWYWARFGKRPVAPPRDAREKVWHRLFSLVFVAIVVLCVGRAAGDRWVPSPLLVHEWETRAGAWLSIAASIVGFGGALVAQSQMGASWRIGIPNERTALVERGFYARVRNPIYTGFLLALLGLAALLPGIASALIFAVALAIMRAWVRLEEARQLEVHGDAFLRYQESTGRFLPRLGARAANPNFPPR